jgi:hypothetical protein
VEEVEVVHDGDPGPRSLTSSVSGGWQTPGPARHLGPKAARLVSRTLEPADADDWRRAAVPLENVLHAAGLLRLYD